MALGRVRRSRAKVKEAHALMPADVAAADGVKMVKAHSMVWRTSRGRYGARACLGLNPRYQRTRNVRCTRIANGRTPQSAIAKAFKALGQTLATRGRGRR